MSTSTLAEVLDLPFALVTVFMAVLRALVTAPFRHRGTRRSPRSLYLYLVYSALRCLVIRISPKQCQMVMPSSHFTHQFVGMLAGQRRLAKAAAQGGSVKAEADTAVVLPHNATGHWVGAPEAEVVVMWFHGMFSLAFVPVPDPLVAIDEVEHETRNLEKNSQSTHALHTNPSKVAATSSLLLPATFFSTIDCAPSSHWPAPVWATTRSPSSSQPTAWRRGRRTRRSCARPPAHSPIYSPAEASCRASLARHPPSSSPAIPPVPTSPVGCSPTSSARIRPSTPSHPRCSSQPALAVRSAALRSSRPGAR